MNKSQNLGAGFFVTGMAMLTIGLAIRTVAFWIIGLVLVAFGLLVTRKTKKQE